MGGTVSPGGGQYMLGYIVRGGQYILGYIVRGTIYPRLYCPGGQYKGGQYILRHRRCARRGPFRLQCYFLPLQINIAYLLEDVRAFIIRQFLYTLCSI